MEFSATALVGSQKETPFSGPCPVVQMAYLQALHACFLQLPKPWKRHTGRKIIVNNSPCCHGSHQVRVTKHMAWKLVSEIGGSAF